ncbi:hypothetical protein VTO73DRAFT_6223 [Trametes versicolor]
MHHDRTLAYAFMSPSPLVTVSVTDTDTSTHPYTTMYCPPCVSYLVSRPASARPPAPLRRGLYLRPSRSLFGDPRDGSRLALDVNSSPRPRVVASRPSRHNCIDPFHISCMSISEPSFWLAIYNTRH